LQNESFPELSDRSLNNYRQNAITTTDLVAFKNYICEAAECGFSMRLPWVLE
jgi:hypothetical protein